ncbi:beta-ketoacyl-[acyl-carrier-protein] synthase III A, chloroplastic-like [Rutidosis leptorrhynchoides]|uniref:beta-ketoacyl-[acyl-carrier-protein] synthase III A, chloroplastic-like n=1 Tax=Rutidosis leptorrhynchoides TaxID=125765 RepID=UPI003A9A301B
MEIASLVFTPKVPQVNKMRVSAPSGFYSPDAISMRVSCSSTVQGSDQLSASKSQPSRLVGKGCKLVGCGSAIPNLQVSNDDISKIVDTNDEWIAVRTGIRNRRVLTGKDRLANLSVEAAQKALEMAKVNPDDVDLVLLCTSSPDDLFGNAPQIQAALGCTKNPPAFDITAACSGFLVGLISASCYIRGGGFKNVLVIGADALTRHLDWTDRGTCILFGDGAGAVLVQACDSDEDGLFGFDLHTDGEGSRHLNISIKENETDGLFGTNGSAVEFPPKVSSYSFLQMNGREVFKFACQVVPQSIEIALENAGMTRSNVDWLVLHQANKRILDVVATRLEIPADRIISNLANYGNTSAASIPLALDEAVRSGKIKSGQTIATAGFGAGLSWGSAIIRWN